MSQRRPLRVLLVTRHYPPASEVGGLRPAKLVRALRAAGHHVHVVTTVVPERAPESSVGVTRVTPHMGPRQLLVGGKRLLRAATGRGDNPAPAGAVTPTPAAGSPSVQTSTGLRATIRSLLLSVAWLPDDHQGFILPAVAAIVREANESTYDVLVSSAPPFSTHLAGLLGSALTGLPLVAEFRDPWIYGEERPAHLHPMADRLNRWMEQLCLRRSDQVVAVTFRTGAFLAERCAAIGKSPPLVFLNGIDGALSPPPTPRRSGTIRVLYIGELYGGRDPRPFLRSLARLRSEGAFGADGVQVDFVGDSERYGGQSLQAMLEELALGSIVRLRGRISHEASLQLQQDADVLLLLAQQQPLQVPNKLYEYFAAQRPILAYVDRDGESAEMLRQVGGHFLVSPDDPDERADAVVRAALAAPRETWRPHDPSRLDDWQVEVQFARYVDALASRYVKDR